MDETSYSDPAVITYINELYVPIRVDNDQRPDINARYNMGGWPTTALLTPDGELMTGGTYVPPEAMRELLPHIALQYNSSHDEIARKAQEMRERRAAAAPTQPTALSTALAVSVPFRIVQLLSPERDTARLKALSLPPHPSDVAYVCLGTICCSPVTDPSALAETVRQMRSAASPTTQ